MSGAASAPSLRRPRARARRARRLLAGLSLTLAAALAVGCVAARAGALPANARPAPSPGTPAPGAIDPAVADVVARARTFVAALPPDQRAAAVRAFADAERTRWAFVPGRYAGVELGALDATSLQAAHELLRALLGARGFATTMAIVQLEDVLRELERRPGRDAAHRDPGRYALLLLGEPGMDGAFAVRLQGHHVSLHFTFFAGWLVGATPHFLGSSPHEHVGADGARRRVLADEEDLARELLASLDDAQRAAAWLSREAPPDILLGPAATFAALEPRRGLAAAAMTPPQRTLLARLVETFAHRLRPELAAHELARLQPQLADARFVWLGGRERGEGHYWRVQGDTFAIELDNTQDGANHVHTVWRDLERDFGADPLREHLEQHRRASRAR